MADSPVEFNDGEPIDAKKLQDLVTFVNQVNATAMKVPSGSAIARDVVNEVMVAGTTGNIEVEFTGKAKSFPVTFKPALKNDPLCVIATLQCPSADMDLVHYIQNPTLNGFNIMINRVAGLDEGNTVYTKSRIYNVIVHYFAIAKPS